MRPNFVLVSKIFQRLKVFIAISLLVGASLGGANSQAMTCDEALEQMRAAQLFADDSHLGTPAGACGELCLGNLDAAIKLVTEQSSVADLGQRVAHANGQEILFQERRSTNTADHISRRKGSYGVSAGQFLEIADRIFGPDVLHIEFKFPSGLSQDLADAPFSDRVTIDSAYGVPMQEMQPAEDQFIALFMILVRDDLSPVEPHIQLIKSADESSIEVIEPGDPQTEYVHQLLAEAPLQTPTGEQIGFTQILTLPEHYRPRGATQALVSGIARFTIR